MTRLTHRGHLQATALIVTASSERALQADVLAHLSPGDRIHAIDPSHPHATFRLLILFAKTRRLEVALTRGIPLQLDGHLMTSFPLSKQARAQAIESQAELVVAHEGEAQFARLGASIDPSHWLDLSAFQLVTMHSLGAPPPPVVMALTTRDSRAVLGRAPLSKEGLAAMKALLTAPNATGPSSALLDAIVRALATVMRLAQGLFGTSSSTPTTPTKPAQLPHDTRAYEPPWVVRKLASWIDALRMRAWQSSLGSYLAKKHAEYIARLMELLERGDIDEALRRAIPLSATAGAGEHRAPSLTLPSPRTDLSIAKTRTTGGSLGLGDSLYAILKARYRALYDKLIALDRIDDAAFVLAELLDDVLGAVALLEKHGKTQEAAELAEARNLEPAILVRQWIIAKNLPRALLLARRHGAFEAAITHLRNEPEARKTLAIAWADVRAEAGDYLGALLALELGQATHEVTALALTWAEHAHQAGGANAAVALVWRARLMHSLDAETEHRARSLLLSASEGTLTSRTAFATALAARNEPFLAPLARLVLRTSTRDRALFDQPPASTLEKLETLGGDGVLRVDRPIIEPLPKPTRAGTKIVSMGARGAMAIHDAALLPSGNWLVALGEAGTRILKPDGATLVAFDAPASKLVIADSGTRALALAFRGELTIVHRIDAHQRRSGDAFEVARMTSHASSFDGERWAVVLDGAGHVLDVLQERPRSLFRVEHCQRVDRALGCISFESRNTTIERLRYDEKGLVLRVRQALPERFDASLNPHPFQAVYEPTVALLESQAEGLCLKIGAVPHPTPYVFSHATLRGGLSAGRTHIAFHMSEHTQTLGRYTLLESLSLGVVRTHLARVTSDVGPKLPVRLESCDISVGDSETVLFHYLAPIAHKNIILVHEAGTEDGFHYIATERIFGMDLRAILRRLGPQNIRVPASIAVSIAMQMCSALHAAHNQTSKSGAPFNIVHRHIAPSECIVAWDGVVKLRLTRLNVQNQGLRSAPTLLRYLSPEQVLGLPLDRRSDVFNLGILLYELLTGQPLFKAATDVETITQIRDADVPSIQSRAPVSNELAAIVHKALARDRADRWQSAEALQEALEALHLVDLATSESALATWLRAHIEEFGKGEQTTLPSTPKPSTSIATVNTTTGDIAFRIESGTSPAHRILFTDADGETLVAFDEEGRLLALDLQSERVIGLAAIR